MIKTEIIEALWRRDVGRNREERNHCIFMVVCEYEAQEQFFRDWPESWTHQRELHEPTEGDWFYIERTYDDKPLRGTVGPHKAADVHIEVTSKPVRAVQFTNQYQSDIRVRVWGEEYKGILYHGGLR